MFRKSLTAHAALISLAALIAPLGAQQGPLPAQPNPSATQAARRHRSLARRPIKRNHRWHDRRCCLGAFPRRSKRQALKRYHPSLLKRRVKHPPGRPHSCPDRRWEWVHRKPLHQRRRFRRAAPGLRHRCRQAAWFRSTSIAPT